MKSNEIVIQLYNISRTVFIVDLFFHIFFIHPIIPKCVNSSTIKALVLPAVPSRTTSGPVIAQLEKPEKPMDIRKNPALTPSVATPAVL